MKLYLSLFFLFLFQIAFTQHEPLQSSGDIPKDFTVPSYVKYKKELENVDRKSKRRSRKNQKEFFLESNFGIDDFLQSGYVMFDDPISKYVTEVANVLLENEPNLKGKLRFYTVRSESVNAFATNQGIVLVNMGLIAQLKNEAQLAFILAHEIAHYKEKHALKFYLESKEIDRRNNKSYLKRKDFEDTMTKNQFSKEQESEADELGLDLFLKSNYDLKSVQGAFDVLQYSYLPFAETPFNKSSFEDEYLIFPDDYQLDSIQFISTEVSDDDEESTHPSIPKRRTAADNIIGNTSNDGKQNFIVSESKFKELQQKARYELLDYHLRNYEFYQSLYAALSLQKDYPEDLYLKKVIAKSLYGFTKFRNARQFSDYRLKHKKVEGELGSVVYFINEMEKFEMNALALRYAYLLKDEFKDDEVFQNMVEDICQDMVNKHSKKLKKFKAGIPPKVLTESPDLNTSSEEDLKNDDAKNEKAREEIEEKNKSRYVYYGFGDLLEQEEFNSMIKTCTDIKKKNKEEDWENEQYSSKDNSYSKGNFALGENKVLVLNPFYLKLKKGFKDPLLIQTEKSQIEFNGYLQKISNMLDLKLEVLDANNFSKNDVERFNDLLVIQEWFGHQMNMEDGFSMIAFNQERLNAIAKKYNIDTFVWTGVLTGKAKRDLWEIYGKLIFNQFSWLYGLVSPKGGSAIFSIVLDADTGKARMGTFDFVSYVDHKDIVKQRVYDILSQIKKKPRK